MMENFRGLRLDTVVTAGATTGTIWRRELLGWPGPNTEMREMAGRDTVLGLLLELGAAGSWKLKYY